MSNAFAELVEEAANEGVREWARVRALAMGIDVFLEIGVQILENQVKNRLGLAVGVVSLVGVFDAEEANDVEGLREHLEKRDLAEGSWRNAFFVHFELRLLQSHQLAGASVFRFVHLTVRSFSYLL